MYLFSLFLIIKNKCSARVDRPCNFLYFKYYLPITKIPLSPFLIYEMIKTLQISAKNYRNFK